MIVYIALALMDSNMPATLIIKPLSSRVVQTKLIMAEVPALEQLHQLACMSAQLAVFFSKLRIFLRLIFLERM